MHRRASTATAIALILTACGGSGTSSTEASSGTATAPVTPTPPPTAEPTPTPTPSVSNPSSGLSPVDQRYQPVAALKGTVGVTLPIGKCLNYGGQLEVEDDQAWRRPVVDSDFAMMKSSGFQTIRIPINFARFAGTGPSYTIQTNFMSNVQHVVDVAIAAGLNVIIDNHVEDALYSDPALGKARMLAIWKQVAAKFKNAPSNVYFELWNEPKPPYFNADLLTLFTPIVSAIRTSNPTRPIIIGGEWSDSVGSLETLILPNDPYVVSNVHYYDPMAFTHQGAPFLTPILATGITYGSDSDLDALDKDLAKVKDYIKRTGRVPFVGEYGAYEGIPLAQRAKYYHIVSRAFASIGVPSCAWGYVNDFPIRTSDGWIPEIVDGIDTVK